MKKCVSVFALLLLVFVGAGCGKSSKSGDQSVSGDKEKGDLYADLGFSKMLGLAEKTYYSDVTNKVVRDFSNVAQGEDVCKKVDYNDVRDCFSNSIASDSSNAKGHLGMSLVEIADLNYDADLWVIIKQLVKSKTEKPVFTSAQLQSAIEGKGLPAINKAIDHLAVTLNDDSFVSVTLTDSEGDKHIVTRSEVRTLRAMLLVFRAFVNTECSYDVQLPGSDGTYGWLTDYRKSSTSIPWDGYSWYHQASTTSSNGKNVLNLLTKYGEEDKDSSVAWYTMLEYNLVTRASQFLTLKSGKDLALVRTDLSNAIIDVREAIKFTKAKTGFYSDDIIKKTFISDLDTSVSDNFKARMGWQTVDDMLSWGADLLTMQKIYHAVEGDVSINLDPFFKNKIADVKSLIFKYRWKDASSWVSNSDYTTIYYYGTYLPSNYTTFSTWFNTAYPGTGSYYYYYGYSPVVRWGDQRWTTDVSHWSDIPVNYVDKTAGLLSTERKCVKIIGTGEKKTFSNISKYIYTTRDFNVDAIEYLNNAGAVLSDGSIKYYPDYTFDGLMPGMTKSLFDSIFQ
jgi:hypothetical protein